MLCPNSFFATLDPGSTSQTPAYSKTALALLLPSGQHSLPPSSFHSFLQILQTLEYLASPSTSAHLLVPASLDLLFLIHDVNIMDVCYLHCISQMYALSFIFIMSLSDLKGPYK